MNKGIILEKHRNYMVILTSDGTFHKGIVVNKDAKIGEEVEFEPYRERIFFQMGRTEGRSLAGRVSSVTVLVALFIFSTSCFINSKINFSNEDINYNVYKQIEENGKTNSDTTVGNENTSEVIAPLSGDKEKGRNP
ncbi:anti-sigma factor domain-containing protein [Oceanobacillus sp. FSL H7-0719]|uniref:anti-sigma factor domain-containing protein n=1 Tax=Oceanobacillus sp. FSL H7-0719 TaxID=2954507 RepID=UPI00324B90AD